MTITTFSSFFSSRFSVKIHGSQLQYSTVVERDALASLHDACCAVMKVWVRKARKTSVLGFDGASSTCIGRMRASCI